MVNEIRPDIPQVQPLPEIPVLPPRNWFKILLFIIFGLIVIAGLVFVGINIGKTQQSDNHKSNPLPSSQIVVNSSTSAELNPISNNFCGNQNYCSMNKICSALPPNHGVCTPNDMNCSKYNLCGSKDTLMESGMEVMFVEMISKNGKTRIGYMLVRNTNNSKQDVSIEPLECLNYEGLCKNITVTYPSNFQINAKDVVIFPIYIENQGRLKGLSALEFTFKIGGKLSMVGIDVIFNNDKTCIYQWGGQEESRRVYFQEESKIDWTQHCQ